MSSNGCLPLGSCEEHTPNDCDLRLFRSAFRISSSSYHPIHHENSITHHHPSCPPIKLKEAHRTLCRRHDPNFFQRHSRSKWHFMLLFSIIFFLLNAFDQINCQGSHHREELSDHLEPDHGDILRLNGGSGSLSLRETEEYSSAPDRRHEESGHHAAAVISTSENNEEISPLVKRRRSATIFMVHPDDLEFSDTSEGRVTDSDQQDDVIFINHGGGAVSSVRRSFTVPNHFSPHVSSYPQTPFDGSIEKRASASQSPPSASSQDSPSSSALTSPPVDRRMLQDDYRGGHEFVPESEFNDDPDYEGGFGTGPIDIPRLISRRAGQHDSSSDSSLSEGNGDRILNPYQPEIGSGGGYDDPNDPNTGSRMQAAAQPTTQPTPVASPPNRNPNSPLDEVTSPFLNFNPLNPTGGVNPFSPESFFNLFDGPFSRGAAAPPPPASGERDNFQRRRLNNGVADVTHNSLGPGAGYPGYPSYNYYKGVDDESENAGQKWPKVFKFTDGRINLNEFEKDKKLGKVKFQKRDPLLESVRRDSFLILHGGTYS